MDTSIRPSVSRWHKVRIFIVFVIIVFTVSGFGFGFTLWWFTTLEYFFETYRGAISRRCILFGGVGRWGVEMIIWTRGISGFFETIFFGP